MILIKVIERGSEYDIIFLNADHQLVPGSCVSQQMCVEACKHLREEHNIIDGPEHGGLLDMSWYLQKHMQLHPPITRRWPDLNDPEYGYAKKFEES